MAKGKILFISQEISPYLPSNPISDLGKNLPQAIQEKGYEVRIFMPRYGIINERRNQLHEVIRLSGMNLVIDDSDHPLIIKVASLQPSRMQVYFIDSEDYFHRNAGGKETETHPDDNDERSIFFVRGVLETVKKLRWEPSLVQCAGWIGALAPLYVKNKLNDDPSFKKSKLIYVLLNDRFDGTLDPRLKNKLIADGFDEELLEGLSDQGADYQALTKFAITTSDAIIQASADVDEDLINFARESGKPFLPYSEENDIFETCYQFYNDLLES